MKEPVSAKSTSAVLIALIGIVPACLTAYLGYLGGVKQTSTHPPSIEINPAAEKTPDPAQVGWSHKTFTGGKEAADYLSLPTEQPKPNEVYATLAGGRLFYVWWKATKSNYVYTYHYVPWNASQPDKVPLPRADTREVPIGFGSADGQSVFTFFQANRQQ